MPWGLYTALTHTQHTAHINAMPSSTKSLNWDGDIIVWDEETKQTIGMRTIWNGDRKMCAVDSANNVDFASPHFSHLFHFAAFWFSCPGRVLPVVLYLCMLLEGMASIEYAACSGLYMLAACIAHILFQNSVEWSTKYQWPKNGKLLRTVTTDYEPNSWRYVPTLAVPVPY